MARRGSFGRSPRPAQSLTNVIVSIAREMQQQRDQNIVDAWMKGGRFEGKKVTDEMILKHWRDRQKGLDKDDPLYDAYVNAYMEYEYAISESKMTVRHAKGEITDKQAAQFYLDWSKKVPKNSEFYRILQRDAAQLTRDLKAKSEAEKRRLAEEKYQKDLKAIYDRDIKPGEEVNALMNEWARKGARPSDDPNANPRVNVGGAPLLGQYESGEYEDFTNFDSTDVEEFVRMVTYATDERVNLHKPGGRIAAGGGATERVLFHRDDGTPVTGASLLKDLQASGYEGSKITLEGLAQFYEKGRSGAIRAAELAEKTGHANDAIALRKQASAFAMKARATKSIPVQKAVMEDREDWMHVLRDPNASAEDRIAATDKWNASLKAHANDPRVKNNDVYRNQLLAQANGDASAAAVAEDFAGTGRVEGKEIAQSRADYDRDVADVKDVAAGKKFWTQGEYQNGAFVPSPGGTAVGAADPYAIQQATGGLPSQVVVLKDRAGRSRSITLFAQAITTKAVDPKTGKEIPIGDNSNPVVGYVYDYPNGRKTVGFKGRGNTMLFSDIQHAPWEGARLDPKDGETAGYTLTINPPEGLNSAGFKIGAGNKVFYDPYAAMLGTSPDRATMIVTGTGDKNVDFASINLAYYNATPEGQKSLGTLRNDPVFKTQVERETRLSLGFQPQLDPKTGDIIGWTGGDENALTVANQQRVGGFGRGSTWDRSTPVEKFDPEGVLFGSDPNWTFAGAGGFGLSAEPIKPLGTSSLSDQPVSLPFQSGTLNRRSPQSAQDFELRLSGALRVPSAEKAKSAAAGLGLGFVPGAPNVSTQGGTSMGGYSSGMPGVETGGVPAQDKPKSNDRLRRPEAPGYQTWGGGV